MRLSLVAIMLDEEEHVPRWLAGVRRLDGVFDDILVVDGGSQDGTVPLLTEHGVQVVHRPFGLDFSEQRNFGTRQVLGDWIAVLDADEILSVPLLGGLRTILRAAQESEIDCIGVPRLNFHDHILQPGPGHRGLDYQYRFFQRHCVWQGKVHEEVVGFKARLELSLGDGHFIQHLKSTRRHEERNALYQRMQT